jgi:hypothetical protein
MLKELRNSEKTGRVVRIRLRKKRKVLVTAVQEVNSRVITVKAFTLYGRTIPNRTILMEEIESVRSFNSHFDDPMFVKLRDLKNSIRKIRAAVHDSL